MSSTIPELVKSKFNVDVKLLNRRFSGDGWELEGESSAVCTDCDFGTRLLVFRKPYESSGKSFKYWCVVCLTCKEAAALRNYDADSRKLITKSLIEKLPQKIIKYEPKCTHSNAFGNCPNMNCPKKLISKEWTVGWSLSRYSDNQVYKCKYGKLSLNERLVVANEIFAVLDNFIDTYLQPETGYIYKIESENGKIYIGSSNNPDQRWEQHKKTIDTSPLHTAMQSEGIDKFTFTVIDTVEYIDVETLLIKESVLMNEYNSIESGYNTKHSVDLQNLY
jgi:hypothetical protein